LQTYINIFITHTTNTTIKKVIYLLLTYTNTTINMYKDPDTLVCQFNNSYVFEISRDNLTILGGDYDSFPIWHSHIQNMLEKHLKTHDGDIIEFRSCGLYSFNKVYNQFVQIHERICNALKHKIHRLKFTYDIYHEILCSCCKKNRFTPRYTHVNMCNDCVEIFFD
jgi:hypothetical protein